MENIMTNRLDRGFYMYQKEFEDAALRTLRSGWYILGNELKSFEEKFAAYTGAKYSVEPDGESRFVRSKLLQDRKIILSYKYQSGSDTVHARDTLTFRNRIRDGVNEWQDENPQHYK